MAEDKKKPIILSIDDDLQVLRSLKNDLRQEFRDDYRIISTSSANEALQTLLEWKKKGETVALFLSDQRMPEMEGVEFLEQAKNISRSQARPTHGLFRHRCCYQSHQ